MRGGHPDEPGGVLRGLVTPRWLATCPEETKGVLVDELRALGVGGLVPSYRAVAFSADLATAYRAHLCLRTASRLQRLVGELPATSVEALAAAAAGITWPGWLRAHRPFTVAAVLTDAGASSLGEDAVVAAVAGAVSSGFPGARAPRFDPDAESAVTVVAHVRAGVCTLGLDTAGRALHKRGWRVPGHPAVLKETLAAAILMLAGWDGTEPLYDPMCGSGTLVIEGAMLALHKAPLLHRGKDDFGFEHHAGFDRALWRQVSDTVRLERLAEVPAPLFASDLRAEFVEVARRGALRARVERHVQFSVGAIQDARPPARAGLLVTNLPYGQRIGGRSVATLYADVGRVIRERFGGWRIALLVPEDAPRGALQLRVQREIALRNGALPVRLLLCGG